MYEGGTYAVQRRSLALLRWLPDRDRARLVSGLPRGGRVLEVGAGDGRLVARMREGGLDAWGIDPSPAACAAAARVGIEVRNAGVGEAEVAPASQDAVVLWHSLEHLDEPAAAITRIEGWLRPGGALVVAVPNAAGLQARLGGDRWFHQDVPRHRTHFSPAGMVALLERTGFRIERIRHLLVEQNPFGMWQTLLNRMTVERDFVYRLIKRDLERTDRAARLRDLAVSCVVGAALVPVALILELAADLAGRGGSMVVEARARG
jgi:2-polyprenyl-3-methyl-5-hydroxy-6-metoxy-1,4-benzoquinol methylase